MTGESARDEILRRVRDSLADRPAAPAVSRDYHRGPTAGVDLLERFAERVAGYRAEVVRCHEPDVALEIAAALAGGPEIRVAVPDGLQEAWRAGVRGAVTDEPVITHALLNAIDAVVTDCAVAIADTGTIVLDAGPGQGRRALTLLPDRHVCVVLAEQIVADVATALERLDPGRPLTWISGPSATSDIELARVEGVHGPRNLHVIIVLPGDGVVG